MAVAFGANYAPTGTTTGTTLTFNSVVVASGDVVFFRGSERANADVVINSIDFNGSSAGWASVGGILPYRTGSGCTNIWVGKSLTPGTGTLTVTFSASALVRHMGTITVVSGADSTTPHGTAVATDFTGAATSVSTSVTIASDGMGLSALWANSTSASITASGSQANQTANQGGGDGKTYVSSTLTGSGSAVGYSFTAFGDTGHHVALPVLAASGGATAFPDHYYRQLRAS